MRKKLWTAALACMMALAISVPVFAADWVQDSTGWWYQYDDGGYPNNGWSWINGKCYYFTPEGYCLTGTQTPDGYTVDESGAWTVDGVVQVQAPDQTENVQASGGSVQIDGMTFTAPEGFIQQADTSVGFAFHKDYYTLIIYASEELTEIAKYQDLINVMQKMLLDQAITRLYGAPTSSSSIQVPTGTWYRYDYADAYPILEINGSIVLYAKISGTKMQMMVFAGDLSGIDTNAIMNNNLK